MSKSPAQLAMEKAAAQSAAKTTKTAAKSADVMPPVLTVEDLLPVKDAPEVEAEKSTDPAPVAEAQESPESTPASAPEAGAGDAPDNDASEATVEAHSEPQDREVFTDTVKLEAPKTFPGGSYNAAPAPMLNTKVYPFNI